MNVEEANENNDNDKIEDIEDNNDNNEIDINNEEQWMYITKDKDESEKSENNDISSEEDDILMDDFNYHWRKWRRRW